MAVRGARCTVSSVSDIHDMELDIVLVADIVRVLYRCYLEL